jgi:hypothetical protein
MKYALDQPITTTSTPTCTCCFPHKNRFASPVDRQDTEGLGRNVYYGTTVFSTPPILTSERLVSRDGRFCLLTSDGVDDLSHVLDSLSIDTATKEKGPPEEKRGVSPSTERLISETPEACNPSFGRCKQTMVDPKTNTLWEVTRSLRLTKSD